MKTRKVIPVLMIIAAMMSLTGCYKPWHHVEGNMDVQTETRDVSSFEKVYNEGTFEVYVIQDGESKVEIEAESNLIPLIRTRIEGSALVVDTKDDLRNNFPMKVYVHTDEIREVRLSGSGILSGENIETGDLDIELSGSGEISFAGNAEDVNVDLSGSGNMELNLLCSTIQADISGSGNIDLTGTASSGELRISGSGNLNAYEFALQTCQAKISGSGCMYLNVEDHLEVTISGSGDVYYLGTPVIETHISGSGNIIHP
jgi:hypothetical protein